MCIPSSFSSWSVCSSSVGWIFGCWFNSFVVFDWCFVVYGWDDESAKASKYITVRNSWYGNLMEMQFSQNFKTKKLGEITVFYVV